MDPFKKVELKDKVNNYKANLTKLIRIDEAKHYYNYFLAYKKNLLQTWDGTWETININIKSSKEINYLQVNNKTITGIKDIVNEFNIHSFKIAKKFKKKKKKKNQFTIWINTLPTTTKPGLDKSCMCICDVFEIINFTNCQTWSFFNKYVHILF